MYRTFLFNATTATLSTTNGAMIVSPAFHSDEFAVAVTSTVGSDAVDPAENITRLFRTSQYNDDGLFFSLAFGGTLYLIFGLLMTFLLHVRVLWIRRLYRPNHTLSPPEASALLLLEDDVAEKNEEETSPHHRMGAVTKRNSISTPHTHRRGCSHSYSTRSSSSSSSTNKAINQTQVYRGHNRHDTQSTKSKPAVEGPPTEDEEGLEVQKEDDLQGEEGRREKEEEDEEKKEKDTLPLSSHPPAPAKKRRGIMLPYSSALFCLPTWSDWWSVEEESLPYLQPLFPRSQTSSSADEDAVAVGRHNRVHVVVTDVNDDEKMGKVDFDVPTDKMAAGQPFSSSSPVVVAPPAVTSSDTFSAASSFCTSSSPLKGTSYSVMEEKGIGGDPNTPLHHRRRSSRSSRDSRSEKEKEKESAKEEKGEGEVGNGGGPRPCGKDEEESLASPSSAAADESFPPLPLAPLAYVDPQVSLYLFTLKYVATFLLAGVLLFTSWICLLSSRGDYVATSTIAQNADFCHMLDGSKDRCMAVAPKCAYAENISTTNTTTTLLRPTNSTPNSAVQASFRSSSFLWRRSGEGDEVATSDAPQQTEWWSRGWPWHAPLSHSYTVEEEDAHPAAITRYEGECFSVAVPGLAQLSVENVPAGSALWWGVAICNIGFTFVFVACTVFFVRKVNVFVEQVMREQLLNATGYRVACVRGLAAEEEGVLSEKDFRKKYLTQSAYFRSGPPPPLSRSSSLQKIYTEGGGVSGEKDDCVAYGQGNGAGVSSGVCRVEGEGEEEAVEEGQVLTHSVSCWRLDCLYSIVRIESYRTTPRDAIFTQPGRVMEISLVRDPPPGMYRAMKKTKKAKAALEEVVAHEKALQASYRATHPGLFSSPHRLHGRRCSSSSTSSCRRCLGASNESHEEEEEGQKKKKVVETERSAKKRKKSDGDDNDAAEQRQTDVREVFFEGEPTTSPSGDEENEGLPILYCQAPLRSGLLRRIPALSFYTDRYRERTEVLNQLLRQVPEQRAAGSVFLLFADARSTFEFVQLFNDWKGRWSSGCSAVVAGPASGILHGNLPLSRRVLFLRVFIFSILFMVLVLFWSIPIGLLSSVNNLAVLPGVGLAFYEAYLTYVSPMAQLLLSAYLPVLVLSLFNQLLPHIIHWMMAGMGVFNETERFGGRLYFQYLFMVLTNVIFQMALQGGIRQLSEMVLSGVDINTASSFFVSCVMPHGGYWYAKVILGLSLSTWLELLEILRLLSIFWHHGTAHVQRGYNALFRPNLCFDFPNVYSSDLTLLSVGLLFHMTCPLLSLFVALYFLVRYHTMRQRLYERYRPGSESALGAYHPAHDCTNFGISALVVRIVVSLFMLSEFCAVCLFTIRSHTGGQVLSVLTFCIGAGLWMWVFLQTRCWVSCLENARRFIPVPPPLPLSSSSSPGCPSLLSSTTSLEALKRRSKQSSTPTPSTTTTGGDAAVRRGTPPLRGSSPVSSRASNGGKTFSHHSVSPRPFSDPLLPSQSSLLASYHPKHQRLVPIDVDADVAAMKATDHVVEPYWT